MRGSRVRSESDKIYVFMAWLSNSASAGARATSTSKPPEEED